MTIAPPNWKKDAVPTARGWAHPRTGEVLKSQKISQADINDYLGVPEAPVISVAEAQAMVDAQPAHVTDPEMLVEEVRKDVSPKKGLPANWLRVMEEAQSLGLTTSATNVIGFGETLEQRVTI